MANADTPFGAKLIGSFSECTANGQINPYVVLAADAAVLFIGSTVKLTGTLGLGPDGLYYPVITIAGTGDEPVGFATGFKPNPLNLELMYNPANTLGLVYVMDDPYAKFQIQTDGTGAVGDVGQNADITNESGSVFTGTSTQEISQSSVTGLTAQLRILDIMRQEDNEVGANMKWICMFNEHSYKITTGV